MPWEEPDSNQTSRMLFSLEKAVPPQPGQAVPGGRRSEADLQEPGVRAFLLEDLRDVERRSFVGQGFSAGRAGERGNGDAPGSLPGDAPVGPAGDHAGHAFLAPGGDPPDPLHGLQGPAPQAGVVQGDEPLLRGPEDDGLFAAPAVGIGVGQAALLEESPVALHVLGDARVRVEDVQAGVARRPGDEFPVLVDGRVDIDAVGLPGQEVVVSVAGGGMHGPGAVLESDVFGQHEPGFPIDEGMPGREALQLAAGEGRQDLGGAPVELLGDGGEQAVGQDINFPSDFDGRVLVVGVEGDGHVGRQGPGCRRPDEDVGLLPREGRVFRAEVGNHGKADVDRGRDFVLVLDLGFGQGGLAVGAPVNGPLALEDVARGEKRGQEPEDSGLVGGLHGQVGMVPVPQNPQALEGLPLDVDVFQGVVPAGLADLDDGQILFLFSELAVHVDFDGQAVAIPAGDVRRAASPHAAGLDDKILEDLVEGRAEVDVAVGVRGTVVEHESRLSGPPLQDLPVQTDAFPAGDHLGLFLGQGGLHGEGGLRQVERRLEVVLLGHRGLRLSEFRPIIRQDIVFRHPEISKRRGKGRLPPGESAAGSYLMKWAPRLTGFARAARVIMSATWSPCRSPTTAASIRASR